MGKILSISLKLFTPNTLSSYGFMRVLGDLRVVIHFISRGLFWVSFAIAPKSL